MIRKTCLLCNSKLNEIFSFEMPVYMGINQDDQSDPKFENMVFSSCSSCGEVQMNNLIDLNVLYQLNHNNGVIGKTWENHYVEFAKFMENDIAGRDVLEISDPSAKLAGILKDFKSWTIIEPNAEKIDLENVRFIKRFFDQPYANRADVIVHSHLLEHMYDPVKFLADCSASMKPSADMYISVPNLEYILKQKYSPNNILHFEHTYYLNDAILNFMLHKNSLQAVRKKNYGNHSCFYHIKKRRVRNIVPPKLDLANSFVECYKKHKNAIISASKTIKQSKIDWYIFGSHVSSQFYLNNGLDEKLFKGTLDNSTFKQGSKLYGTDLTTFSPDKIKGAGKVGVVCSHAGVYFEEIKRQLEDLNKKVVII